MRSVIVKAGADADGDGHGSYAARRRNLACRPSALGRITANTKACRPTAPNQPAIQWPNTCVPEERTHRQPAETTHVIGHPSMPGHGLDSLGES
jgi:hypothetical protein